MQGSETTRVLVIDGDTVRRGMLACSLPPSDFVLEFAKSAEAGLDLLGRQLPAVVLVGLDATTADLCQRIRLLPAGSSCLLLVMDEGLGEASEAGVAGADAALPFPFDVAVFEELLVQHRNRPVVKTLRYPAAPVDPRLGKAEAEPEAGAAAEPAELEPEGLVLSEEAAWAVFRERVDYHHENLTQLDYFQLLDVPRGATLAEIKDAYFQRSMEFHPDRFMRLEDEALKKRNYEVYKRMTEAFRVLTQPQARSAYLQEDLEAHGESRSVRYTGNNASAADDSRWTQASTPTGCRYLRFAELAYQAGNLRSAKKYLSLAAEWEPSNEELRRKLERVSTELE